VYKVPPLSSALLSVNATHSVELPLNDTMQLTELDTDPPSFIVLFPPNVTVVFSLNKMCELRVKYITPLLVPVLLVTVTLELPSNIVRELLTK